MGIFGNLFNRSDEPDLLRRMRAGADAGDVVAQRGLGALYIRGELVGQDDRKAAKWYALAAAQGDARSLFVLGELHVQGRGVQKDLDEAEKLFTMAAEQGHVAAQTSLAALLDHRGQHARANVWWERAGDAGDAKAAYNIGCSYNDGIGVDPDRARALHWFKRAAELGHPDAQFNLARHLTTGEGIEQDLVRAHAWLTISLGHRADDQTERLRNNVTRHLSADQIARASELAAELGKPSA